MDAPVSPWLKTTRYRLRAGFQYSGCRRFPCKHARRIASRYAVTQRLSTGWVVVLNFTQQVVFRRFAKLLENTEAWPTESASSVIRKKE
jgi:hypothetical protein